MRLDDLAYEWDRAKHDRNLSLRGLGFDLAPALFAGQVVEAPDERKPYPERRVIALGQIEGRVFVCVYADRKSGGRTVRRIISFHKANRRLTRYYHEQVQKEPR
jgi:uncharacterized DUF497 family protein